MTSVVAVMAEGAALAATGVAIAASVPQLHRVIVRSDIQGVSISSAALGIGTELAWIAYASMTGLWSVLPEATVMVSANVVLVATLLKRGALMRSATLAASGWVVMFCIVGAVGGPKLLAAVLGMAYVVQVAPAVWTAWTTTSPSGVAAATWSMVGVEGLLWGIYGIHHGDPATSWFAVVAVVAATAMLTRKATAARRPGTVRSRCRRRRSGDGQSLLHPDGEVRWAGALGLRIGRAQRDRAQHEVLAGLEVADGERRTTRLCAVGDHGVDL